MSEAVLACAGSVFRPQDGKLGLQSPFSIELLGLRSGDFNLLVSRRDFGTVCSCIPGWPDSRWERNGIVGPAQSVRLYERGA